MFSGAFVLGHPRQFKALPKANTQTDTNTHTQNQVDATKVRARTHDDTSGRSTSGRSNNKLIPAGRGCLVVLALSPLFPTHSTHTHTPSPKQRSSLCLSFYFSFFSRTTGSYIVFEMVMHSRLGTCFHCYHCHSVKGLATLVSGHTSRRRILLAECCLCAYGQFLL